MNVLDPGGEWLRISEHYRQLSDSELLVLGRQQSELTEFAQQALAHELSQRGLKVEPDVEKEEPPPIPEAPPNPTYEEDRRLVTICTVWSLGRRSWRDSGALSQMPFGGGGLRASDC